MFEGESGKKKILFFAEAVTLAHVARPAMLAAGLDNSQFEVLFASDPRYNRLFPGLTSIQHDIWSISSSEFTDALAKGKPVYSSEVLTRYVRDDLALIEKLQPDVIVGDFRLSLSISARISGIPYLSISNFYWSPLARQSYPVPELPMVGILGLPLSQQLFNLFRPAAFALHTLPLNRVRREFGLKSLGYNLSQVYTDSDVLLFADIPELASGLTLAKHHHFIGPLLWSPEGHYPAWWDDIDDSIPSIYISLGSSGDSSLLPRIINALKYLPVQLLVTTSGKSAPDIVADNLFMADYLPGAAATAQSQLLIGNGGSISTYQAIECGVPTIGIAGNLDQHLNMAAVESQEAGIRMRSDRLDVTVLRNTVIKLLEPGNTNSGISRLQSGLSKSNPQQAFLQIIKGLV